MEGGGGVGEERIGREEYIANFRELVIHIYSNKMSIIGTK